jgi:predicted histone-like DNA-binding protein
MNSMTVKFTTVERPNPQDLTAPKKHYLQIQNSGKVTVQQLAERAAEMSTFSSADIAAVIEAFLTIVPQELASGNVVSLGDFGSFRLRSVSLVPGDDHPGRQSTFTSRLPPDWAGV